MKHFMKPLRLGFAGFRHAHIFDLYQRALDHPDIEAFVDWKVAEERKVAMLAAGSALVRRHWNALCQAVENSTAGTVINTEFQK